MTSRLVHVSRNGKIIGQYPPEQLASLMDTGLFLESDQCSSETYPEWTPLPEFLKKVQAPRYSRTTPREAGREPERPRTGRDVRRARRERRKLGPILSGWIAFLLSIAVLAGALFWITGLYSEIATQNERLDEMQRKLDEKEKEYQRMLFVAREIAEPGIVRGSLILRNESGKRIAMPGVQISLYPRKVIEDYLEARRRAASQLPAGTSIDGIRFFATEMPRAITSTTTDASGRYEFKVSEPGEYIVSTVVSTPGPSGPVNKLWFVSFDSRDSLNTAVDITETNSVQQFIPSLMIVEGR